MYPGIAKIIDGDVLDGRLAFSLREYQQKKRRCLTGIGGKNEIVVTPGCHVFMAAPTGNLGDWPIPEDSLPARDCRLSDENRANKEIDVI